jgi:hypothetical protein
MINADQREIAENLFKPAREEIKDATSLEEERRAALVKNLNRLKALRLSRDKASLAKTSGWAARGCNRQSVRLGAQHMTSVLNRRVWSNGQWRALGIGIYDGFAAMWVGSEADPTTGLRGRGGDCHAARAGALSAAMTSSWRQT